MNLQECYTALGGNYTEVCTRLHSERLVLYQIAGFQQPSVRRAAQWMDAGSGYNR